MTPETLPDGTVKINANLNGAYATRSADVKEWKRDLEFQGNRLRVQDTWKVGTGVRAIFQLHVRAKPVINPDGSVTAGSLRVQPGAGTQVNLVDMKIYKRTVVEEPEEGKVVTRIVDVFNEGWRDRRHHQPGRLLVRRPDDRRLLAGPAPAQPGGRCQFGRR